jgi:hypothetical protein
MIAAAEEQAIRPNFLDDLPAHFKLPAILLDEQQECPISRRDP